MSDVIKRGIEGIFIADKNALDNALQGQGWRYIAGAICIFPLTLLKVFCYLFINRRVLAQPKETPMEDMHGIGLSIDDLKKSSRIIYTREHIESTNNEVWAQQPYTSPQEKQKKEVKLGAISHLRALFEKNVRLEGTVVKTIHHRISDEDLIESAETGSVKGKFVTQKVTFGNDVNTSLKILFPLLKVRKLKGSQDTFIDFENDEIFELEQKLRQTFMKPVTILLKRTKNEK